MFQLHQAGWLFNSLRERMAERVYEPLYGTKQLHCSKDGFTCQRPVPDAPLNRTPNDHFDQGSLFMGLHCIQVRSNPYPYPKSVPLTVELS